MFPFREECISIGYYIWRRWFSEVVTNMVLTTKHAFRWYLRHRFEKRHCIYQINIAHNCFHKGDHYSSFQKNQKSITQEREEMFSWGVAFGRTLFKPRLRIFYPCLWRLPWLSNLSSPSNNETPSSEALWPSGRNRTVNSSCTSSN